MGGASAPYLLRRAGKDSFMITADVTKALIEAGAVSRTPTAKRELAQAQAAFNEWAAETARPLAHLSRILALSVG